MKIKVSNVNTPNWKDVNVKSHIPAELEKLSELAHNIWWAWNYEATELFRDLDPALWKEVGQNPVLLLERMSYAKLEALANDKVILRRMDDVYSKFRTYMDVKPDSKRPSVAYFSMEYGLSHVLKIYSGGLGVLAGDYLKEASDSNADLCAIGFLYRYGYFTQTLSMDGQQIANYEAQNFGQLPIDRVLDEKGEQMVVDVPYLDYYVHAYVWRVNVGRISLYLLDTDNEMNSEFDRSITHQLYGGDWENRLKQEILLGIGGILTLKKLGIKKDIYHCNEGHAALINVQRICDYVAEGLTYDQAIELVRASSLYTVHTPVPAGHDYFDEGLFGKYMGGYPSRMGISWDDLMDLGRNNPGDKGERFCMSVFACNTSQEVNGVSWLHGKVSQEMFASIWKGYFPEESHVGYVTNGVHFPTWSATEWKHLYAAHFDENFLYDQSNPKIWEAIYNVSDEEIWKTRMVMKNKLIDYVRKQYRETWLKNQGDPSRIVSLLDKINPNALLIGFGRRFATYKRAHLLFTDLDRLAEKTDQSSFPVFERTESGNIAVRGPKNILRTACEFSIECRHDCTVYLGSATDIAATLYAFGLSSLTSAVRAFCTDASELPVAKRLSIAVDPAGLADEAEELGLLISERSARRIMDGEIAPVEPLINRVRIEGDDESRAPARSAKAKAAMGDARGLKIAPDDLDAFSRRVARAFSDLARDYYLESEVKPEVRVGKDGVRIVIPIEKLR